MSNDGVACSHILRRKWRAVNGTVGGGLEGGADAIVAEAICAASACCRLYKGHGANKTVNIRVKCLHAVLTDMCSIGG